ncbi:class I SAM-dependent methyltransferase [Tateyamaria omphalii]|uniref:class I SAM-dependent methyltransferase n=1 Tax=Tateyamaria omphalii TaxID=299262 RepID=UPI001E481A55|nr:class I SAM-dependent methyltransferase [Tateyamaria omphalii]
MIERLARISALASEDSIMTVQELDASETTAFWGQCSICGHEGQFERGTEKSAREAYACPNCRFTTRWRDQASIILDEFGRGQAMSLAGLMKAGLINDLSILEPALRGPFAQRFQSLPNYTQTYFWPELALGELSPQGVRNEDLTRLTFDDNSFDLVLSSDVMEHLFDIEAAFRETLRVLKPGGVHIFTIPNDFPFPDKTQKRVAIVDGAEVPIKPEVYHNSGDGSKCLVYTDYGADLVDMIEELGGTLSLVRRSPIPKAARTNLTFVMRKVSTDGTTRQPRRLKQAQGDLNGADLLKCPICDSTQFEDFNGRVNARCSSCRAVERNRMMWMILDRLGAFKPGLRVLHMAPELGLVRKFKSLSGDDYHATDFDVERYSSNFVKIRKLDLCTDLAAIPDESYDLILHSHVLEHIPCSVPHVLSELDRILAPGGLHFLSVPFRGTTTTEDLSPDLSEAERKKRFGQEDHMRIFGTESIVELLRDAWGEGKHLVEPIEIFSRDELRAAVIPTNAWHGISSHSIFHYRKGGLPPAMEIVAQRTGSEAEAASRTTIVTDETSQIPLLHGLEALRRDNPWPEFPYEEHAPFHLALDSNGDGGREIILNQILEYDVKLMVEVGCFLGGSALHWLGTKPDLHLIGVDPWENSWARYVEDMAKDPSMSRHVAHISDVEVARIADLIRQFGNFAVTMNNLRRHKDRFTPVRRFSPEALQYLSDRSVPVELIYIDAFKHRADLDAAYALFPDAVLCGDDWLWPDETGEFVMQTAIKEFAHEHGFDIEDKRQSWVLRRR